MKLQTKQLVLFDLDGTLIYHVGQRKWAEQYLEGLKIVYGLKGDYDIHKWNGYVERALAWEIAKTQHISRTEFEQRFPLYVQVMYDHLVRWEKKGRLFKTIVDAVKLVERLSKQSGVHLGVLTGNAKRIAHWKLTHTGLDGFFRFGLYGDEADDRVELARTVFVKANSEFHHLFNPWEITVIGDTVHDIRCGKAIGAFTIAVTTGMHGNRETLDAEKPDLLVQSLIDPKVLTYFHL